MGRWTEDSILSSFIQTFRLGIQVNNHLQLYQIKRTVSVFSSDPPYKDVNARFTTAPLKPFSGEKYGRYCVLMTRKECASHLRREIANKNKQF